MSSISGTSLPFQSQSPRDALQTQLQSQISSGEVSESDEQVASGDLTEEQATELSEVFSETFF